MTIKIERVKNLNAILKYLLSFFKLDWKLSDYPIKYEYHVGETGRYRSFWSAEIIGGLATYSTGKTQQEAREKLQQRLSKYKIDEGDLPRPGTSVPWKLASTTAIAQYQQLSVTFFKEILGITHRRWWISDKSDLWTFIEPEQQLEIIEKINKRYKVDISDIKDGNFVAIFQRISAVHDDGGV